MRTRGLPHREEPGSFPDIANVGEIVSLVERALGPPDGS
jgi:hypothetical protein